MSSVILNFMTATGHAVIGIVIAAKVGNPALAIPLAVASHIAADYFPHWDTGIGRKTKGKKKFWSDSILDVVFAAITSLLLIYFVFPEVSLIYAFVVVFASLFLDIMTAPYLFLDWAFPPFIWFYRFQKKFDRPMAYPWGVIGQVAVLVALVVLAKIT